MHAFKERSSAPRRPDREASSNGSANQAQEKRRVPSAVQRRRPNAQVQDSQAALPDVKPKTNEASNINSSQSLQLGLELDAQDADSETSESDSVEDLEEPSDVLEASEDRVPKAPTAKQLKQMARFGETISRDAGAVLDTIDTSSLTPVPGNVAWEQEPELVCCYNWQDSQDGQNTIFVPGEPPKWMPQALPFTLEKDTGFQYSDYNYARKPRDPYAPMFHALEIMNPEYQFMDVDVLADRNNLRVLLEFVQGKNNGPFRLDMYMIYNTLIFVRKETRWWKRSNGISCGGNFEKFFTQPGDGMEDATNHYRAIRYRMGPLSLVVRFEADAHHDGLDKDDLIPIGGGFAGKAEERTRFDYRAPIRTLQKGHIVPTAHIAELKTGPYKPDEFNGSVACQDQLWFGRTAHLMTGRYEQGTGAVRRVKVEDARERVKNWEVKNKENLRKLVALLSRLKVILRAQQGPIRSAVLVREGKGGPLQVRTMLEKRHILRREFFQKHWKPHTTRPAVQRGGFRGNPNGNQRGRYNGGRGQTRGGRAHYNSYRTHPDPIYGRGFMPQEDRQYPHEEFDNRHQ